MCQLSQGLRSRGEQWSGTGGSGSKIAKMKQTEVLKYESISDQTWQRFHRVSGKADGGFHGLVNSVNHHC
jgi:hypothetical protein